jgi:hypothetical protein
MYTHWIVAGASFITLFIFCELTSALAVWLLFASRSSSLADDVPARTIKTEETHDQLDGDRKPIQGETHEGGAHAGQLLRQGRTVGVHFSSRPEHGAEDVEDELSSWDDVDSAHESGGSGLGEPAVKREEDADEHVALAGVSSALFGFDDMGRG